MQNFRQMLNINILGVKQDAKSAEILQIFQRTLYAKWQ